MREQADRVEADYWRTYCDNCYGTHPSRADKERCYEAEL